MKPTRYTVVAGVQTKFATAQQTLFNYISAHRHSARHVRGIPISCWLAAICLLALLVHAPLFFGQFTNYDDGIQITQFNGVTHADGSTVKALLTTNYERKNSNPMYASFVANWYLTPGSYRGFAVFNLAVLVGLVLLFYRFAALFLTNPAWALVATALFSVHSAKAEVIGWMSARCHYLGMPFFLATFIFWDLYQTSISPKRRIGWFLAAVSCAGMAILNKTVFISIVPLIVLFDFYRNRKFDPAFILDKIPLTFAVWTIFRIGGKVAAVTDRTLAKNTFDSIIDRIPSAINITSQYLMALVIPGPTSICADAKLEPLQSLLDVTNHSSLFMYKQMPIVNLVLLTAIGLSVALFWWKRKEPIAAFGLCAILISLFPVLGFVPFWVDFAFRFLWIPIVFFSLMVAGICQHVVEKTARRRVAVWSTVLAIYIALHGVQSFATSQTFDTTPTYWKNCVAHFPESKICLQKLVAVTLDFDKRSAVAAQWRLLKVGTNKQYDHKMTAMILADILAQMGKSQLAALFYERALVWQNARPKRLKKARAYLREHPITPQTRDAVLHSRWNVLW